MTPEAEDRLRAHVTAILAGAAVPSHARADLEEELFGHLVERWRGHVASGLDDGEAAEQAIEDFGTPARLGSELGRTYHSRLWASTIGVLLPAMAPKVTRPGVVGWLRFMLGLTAVLTALVVPTLPVMTPIRLLASAVTAALALTGLLLAYRALARGQRWALNYSIGVALILLVSGLLDVIAPEQPQTLTIPLGSILAVGLLVSVRSHWRELQAFVAPSTRLNQALGIALLISLLAPIIPRTLAAIPDPTQATADDLELLMTMQCDRGDVAVMDGPTLRDVQRVSLVVDAIWADSDLLPSGLAGLVTRPDEGDTSGIRVVRPTEWSWDWAGAPSIVDTETGESAGWWGSTSPSVGLLPEEFIGTFTVGIYQQAIRPLHTIRTTWTLVPHSGGTEEWPQIEVMYAHLDRFLLAGTISCNEITKGELVRPPGVASDGAGQGTPPAVPTIAKAGVVTNVRIYNEKVRYTFSDGEVREVPTQGYRDLTSNGCGGFGLVIQGQDLDGPFVAAFMAQDGLPSDCYIENGVGIERGAYIESSGVLWAKSPRFTSSISPALGEPYPMGTRFCFNDDGLIQSTIAP
jgi:hypothetical protein